MKYLVLFLVFMNVSLSYGRRSGEDNPSPWPLGQAPRNLVGHWLGSVPDEEIVVKHVHATKDTKDRLFVTTYKQKQKTGQGYLYFSDNQMYCGYIHHEGPTFTLCIWKKDETLKSQILQKDGAWVESLWTH